MKTFLTLTAVAFAFVAIAPDEADASRKRGARAKATKSQPVRLAQRSASIGANGLCQRDTGTPNDKLDFRNQCDVEEYWNRIMDRTSAGEQ